MVGGGLLTLNSKQGDTPSPLTSPTPTPYSPQRSEDDNAAQRRAVRRNSKAGGLRGTARKGSVPHEDGPLCRPE